MTLREYVLKRLSPQRTDLMDYIRDRLQPGRHPSDIRVIGDLSDSHLCVKHCLNLFRDTNAYGRAFFLNGTTLSLSLSLSVVGTLVEDTLDDYK